MLQHFPGEEKSPSLKHILYLTVSVIWAARIFIIKLLNNKILFCVFNSNFVSSFSLHELQMHLLQENMTVERCQIFIFYIVSSGNK